MYIYMKWSRFVVQQKLTLYTNYLLFSCSVVSDSLQPYGLQHTWLPCPSPSPGVCSDSRH